jgi:RND superfamily putative drug exporter
MAGRLGGLGSFVYRFRLPVIAIWVVGIATAALPASGVGNVLKGGGFVIPGIESQRAYDRLKADLKLQGQALAVVLQSEQATLSDAPFAGQVEEWKTALQRRAPEAVIQVGPPSQDGHTTLIAVYGVDDYEAQKSLAAAAEGFHISGPARAYLIGPGPFFQTLEAQTQRDIATAEQRSLPVLLVFLLLIFGGLLATGIPLLVGLAAVTLSLAMLALLGRLTDLSIFAESVTTMLGLGIGIDYSLIMVNRFREELRSRPMAEAVAATVGTAGRTVLLSGITVVIGFTALAVSSVVPLRSMGLGGMIVVTFSMLVALTLVPAVLSVVGGRIDWLGLRSARPGAGVIWHRLATSVMTHPIPVILIASGLVLVAALPARTINISLAGNEVLPPSSPIRQGAAVAEKALGLPSTQPLLIALTSSAGMMEPPVTEAVQAFADRVRQDAEVRSVVSYLDLLALNPGSPPKIQGLGPNMVPVNGHTGLMLADMRHAANAPETAEAVKRIRSMPHPPLLQVLIGGEPAFDLDWTDAVYRTFPLMVTAVLTITYLLLMIGFRSLLLPLKAIIMNLLSIAAAYGIVTFIFQWGNLAGVLNFEPQISIESTVPIVMFAALFGLSMDYEVFLLSRVAEEYRRTGDNRQAVALGMERTGRIITSAAMVMVIVFGFFSLSQLVATKEVGLGFAIAVALDATIIRLLLVPAWMRVFGRWNWWFFGARQAPSTQHLF